jgi:hypothetical protein
LSRRDARSDGSVRRRIRGCRRVGRRRSARPRAGRRPCRGVRPRVARRERGRVSSCIGRGPGVGGRAGRRERTGGRESSCGRRSPGRCRRGSDERIAKRAGDIQDIGPTGCRRVLQPVPNRIDEEVIRARHETGHMDRFHRAFQIIICASDANLRQRAAWIRRVRARSNVDGRVVILFRIQREREVVSPKYRELVNEIGTRERHKGGTSRGKDVVVSGARISHVSIRQRGADRRRSRTSVATCECRGWRKSPGRSRRRRAYGRSRRLRRPRPRAASPSREGIALILRRREQHDRQSQ